MTERPHVFTIPSGTAFVDALAAGLLDEVGDEPFALSDARILLPTRRAVRSLREAFLRLNGGKPTLLPIMTPIGDVDEEELQFYEGIFPESPDRVFMVQRGELPIAEQPENIDVPGYGYNIRWPAGFPWRNATSVSPGTGDADGMIYS